MVKMGLLIPISYGNPRITVPITAENTAVFYRGNFPRRALEKFEMLYILKFFRNFPLPWVCLEA